MRSMLTQIKATYEQNQWIAIGLSLLAGLATALGGSIVYFEKFVTLANQSFLSAALGFSAGVMIFISFSELYVDSRDHFITAGCNNQMGTLYAVLSFFAGSLLSFLMEKMLQKGTKVDFDLPTDINEEKIADLHENKIKKHHHKNHKNHKHVSVYIDSRGERRLSDGNVVPNPVLEDKDFNGHETLLKVSIPDESYEVTKVSGNTRDLTKSSYYIDQETKQNLNNMGLMSGIAIAIHNIPEGMISYVGYMDNPVVGLALAIGIGAHNIPEGLSIALPMYYASGSRKKAFIWSLVSGLAEPLGAILCMLVLANYMNDIVFGMLFGITCGIMIYISIFELLPTGITLDCEKNYATIAMLFGFGFIMISFVLLG